MASVELRGLTKRYGEVAVVDDISLTIDHGRLVCLLGPSGCGKTTTLRLIAGFVEPTAGEIRVGDQVISSPTRTVPPERRKMSMIFQSYALWPHMTVAQNVTYGLELRKVDRATTKQKLATILETTHLTELADRYPGELSGGQQQRVALARALIVEPETLLLDEPLSNLDANLREEMRFEVRRLHDEYRYTTVYVTHDQSEAMTTADVIAVMNAARSSRRARPRTSTSVRARNSSPVSSARATSSRAARSMIAISHVPARGCAAAAANLPSAARAPLPFANTWCGCGRKSPKRRKTSCREPWCGRFFSAPVVTISWRCATAPNCAWSRRRPKISPPARRCGSICRRSAAAFSADEVAGQRHWTRRRR